ncbi:MAG: hypothetical protein ACFFDN_22375, partial [Candidatus Hodarchaeota archaeon]
MILDKLRSTHSILILKRKKITKGLIYIYHLIIKNPRIIGILYFTLLEIFMLRSAFLNKGLIFYWDSVPFGSVKELIMYTFNDWDTLLQRPNYRFLYSFFTNWMLLIPLQRFAFFLSFFLNGYCCFELTYHIQKTIDKFPSKILIFSSIISGTLYILFISMTNAHLYNTIMISAGIQPLLFLFFFKSIKDNIKWSAPLVILIFINPMISILIIDITFILIFSFIFIVNGYFKKNKLIIKKVIIVDVIMLLFGIIPYIINIISNIPLGEITFIQMRDLILSKGNLLSTLVPFGFFLPESGYEMRDISFYLSKNPIYLLFLIYLILTIYCLIKYGKKQVVIQLLIGMFLSGISSMGTDCILSPYYIFMRVRKLNPILRTILDAYVILIRKPEKWLISESLFLILLVSISVSKLLMKFMNNIITFKKFKIRIPCSFLVAVFLFILIFSPFFVSPFNLMFTGNLGKILSPITIPQELKTVHDLIKHDEKTLYLPIHTWSRPTNMIGDKRVSDEFFIYIHDVESIEAGGGDSYPINVKFLAPICRR